MKLRNLIHNHKTRYLYDALLAKTFCLFLKILYQEQLLKLLWHGLCCDRRNIDIRFLMADAFSQKHSFVIVVGKDT